MIHQLLTANKSHHKRKSWLGFCLQTDRSSTGSGEDDQPGHRRGGHGNQQPIGGGKLPASA
jgi:hypothetical protein